MWVKGNGDWISELKRAAASNLQLGPKPETWNLEPMR